MKYLKSKTLRDGCLVALRGSKLVLARKNSTKVFGVYKSGCSEVTKMKDMNGKTITVEKKFPEGVAFYGVVRLPVANVLVDTR